MCIIAFNEQGPPPGERKMSPVVHSGASYVNASVSSVTQAAVPEVCALSAQKQVQLLHAVADAKLDTVWSLFVETEDAKVLKRFHVKRAVAATGALMWFDDHVGGAGSRAVLAGTTEKVESARTLLIAQLIEAAMTPDSPCVDAIMPVWFPDSPPYQMPYGTPFSAPAMEMYGYGDAIMPAYPCSPWMPTPAVEATAPEAVHVTQHVPYALMGLLIGVRGASIHAIEHVSGCHLSLDRSVLHTDGPAGVPFVELHIHGSPAGAATAVAMCNAILQRHVDGMEMQHQQAQAHVHEYYTGTCLPDSLTPSTAGFGGQSTGKPPVSKPSSPPSPDHVAIESLALRSRWMRDMDANGSSEGEQ